MWEHLGQAGKQLACRIALLAMVVGSLTVGALAQSQASTGNITGRVVDSTGAGIAGATVKATNPATGLEQTANTNEEGLYRFVLLPPGKYNVTAEASGFDAVSAKDVQVTVGRAIDLDLTLGVKGQTEIITVSAGAIQVQTTRSEPDAIQNELAIQNLPINGRRFQDFVTLTPTAQVEGSRGQISLAGQRGINSNINIDGADNNNPFFGGLRGGERSNSAFTVPQESIKEFQVVAAGYSAEFGRSTGGIVNAVTKSGSNEWHGSAFYLLRHKDFSRTNDFFRDVAEGNPTTPRDNQVVTPAPTLQQWGGSFGGPIIKNKTFFFGSYEQQRTRQPRLVVFNQLQSFTPTAATQLAFNYFKSLEGPFTQTNDAYVLLGRVDHEINSSHRFNVRYTFSDNNAENAAATGEQLLPSTNRALTSNGTEKDRTNVVVGQYTGFLSPTMVNELRAQYARERRPRLANVEQPGVDVGVGSYGTRSFFPTTQFDWRVQVADSISWTKGNHNIKFGGEYNHTFVDQDFGFNRFGVFGARTGDVTQILTLLSQGNAAPSAIANLATYNLQIGNGLVNFHTNELAFFAQDSWRIRPNFTLNYGLRWEGQFNPTPFADNTTLVNKVANATFPLGLKTDPTDIPDALNQFAPRLGFAWDPENKGKSVLRAHGGIYFARSPALIFAGPMNNFRSVPGDVSVLLPFTGVAAGRPTTLFGQLALIGINVPNLVNNVPQLTPAQLTQIASALGLTIDPTRNAGVTSVSSNFRNPRAYQAGVGYEREFMPGLTLGVDFTYVQTVHLERNIDVNLPKATVRTGDPFRRNYVGVVTGPTITGLPSTAAVPRPVSTLGQITLRDSSARSLYRALTFSAKYSKSWGQVNVFYTLSSNYSDDDNERSAGGTTYDDPYNFIPEYNYSDLDRRHQFVANPVFFLPWGFDVASSIRLRSGTPVNARFGVDFNADGQNNDRPYTGVGQPFERNAFRNLRSYLVDLRIQKKFTFRDTHKFTFSVEFFNIFNTMNLEYAAAAQTNYCVAPFSATCGVGGPTNLNFMQLRDQVPTSPTLGRFLGGSRNGPPFQMQLGFRYNF